MCSLGFGTFAYHIHRSLQRFCFLGLGRAHVDQVQKSWRTISSPKTETQHDHVEEGEVQEEFDANFRLLYALSRAYDLFLLNKAKRIQFCVNYVPPSLFKLSKRNN